MHFRIGLAFILFVFLDDQASSSGVLDLRLNAKLKSKEVRLLFFLISSTYTNKRKVNIANKLCSCAKHGFPNLMNINLLRVFLSKTWISLKIQLYLKMSNST